MQRSMQRLVKSTRPPSRVNALFAIRTSAAQIHSSGALRFEEEVTSKRKQLQPTTVASLKLEHEESARCEQVHRFSQKSILVKLSASA